MCNLMDVSASGRVSPSRAEHRDTESAPDVGNLESMPAWIVTMRGRRGLQVVG